MAEYYPASPAGYNSSSKLRSSSQNCRPDNSTKIYVATNPRGVERLPPGIVEPYSDLYLYGLLGNSSEDLNVKPKYLLAVTVGYHQKDIINSIVTKFSANFSIVLFHYDGRASDWEQFEWSQRAIHISTRKQTKWWYAKRFLHPDIVALYEYIFIWDEDLGVEHFNAEEYIRLVKKHGLEISQPAIESRELREDIVDVTTHCCHPVQGKVTVTIHIPQTYLENTICGNNGSGILKESMALRLAHDSAICSYVISQNDLVHGWGLDLNMWRCVERPHENIGIIDAQWIEHKVLPSLGNQVNTISLGIKLSIKQTKTPLFYVLENI
ncbi:hypothetical protein RJ640_008499, partial [Escallonia rubra]